MNDDARPHSPPGNQRPLHVVLYCWGAVILAVGLASAALTFVFREDDLADASRQITSARMYQHNLELMGGKGALYAARFNDWLADLWHGRQLGLTIAVIAVVAAGLCFLLGLLISEPLPDEPQDGPSD